MVIWYIFSRFGMLYKEKSGNPDADAVVEMRLFEHACLAIEIYNLKVELE
jgi:hypothetical protein